MNHKNIEFSVENGFAKIILNRPNALNSFNKEMGSEVISALTECRDNENIRAVLITGSGKAFCAGQDLKEAVPDNEPPADLGDILNTVYNPIIKLIRTIEKPVVAGVNGVAAGAGANIALACDILTASEKASFIQAFSKIGLIPDSGGTYFLPRLVGRHRTAAMVMLADKLSASDAFNYGFVYKVYSEENFEEGTLNLVKHLASLPTKALGLTKRALNASYGNTLNEQLELEKELQVEAGSTEDYIEGVNAFKEKRAANFKGK